MNNTSPKLRIIKKISTKIFFSTFLVAAFLGNYQTKADTVKVYNKTEDPAFVSFYYTRNKTAEKKGKTYEIKSLSDITIERPRFWLFHDRDLIFSTNESNLKNKFNPEEYRGATKVNTGYLKGKEYFLYRKDDLLKSCNAVTWQLVKPIKAKMLDVIEKTREYFIKHEYSGKEAVIRNEQDLSPQEKEYLLKRKKIVKNSLEKMLSMKIQEEETPSIAFCCSGGGMRSALAVLGSLTAAEKFGLLDSSTHIATLSGSTWMVTSWMAQGVNLKTLKKRMYDVTKQSISKTPLANFDKIIADVILPKFAYGQTISSIDFFGIILANKLLSYFGNKRQRIRLSHSQEHLKNGKWIFPIYAAVEVGPPYIWFEFTPYEIGSSILQSYVPSWAFGRKFKNGKSVNNAPEQSLGFLMGIFGSCISVDFGEMIDRLEGGVKPKFLHDAIKKLVKTVGVQKDRFSPAKVFNYMREMPNAPTYKNINFKNVVELTFADAGIDFNIPMPVLLRKERKVDVIIILESSATQKGSPALRSAEEYAKKHKLKFPPVDYSTIENRNINIFKDENDPTVPVIILLPLMKNAKFSTTFDPNKEMGSFCGSSNFKFTKEQIDLISGLAEFNLLENKELIKETIREVILKKRQPTTKLQPVSFLKTIESKIKIAFRSLFERTA